MRRLLLTAALLLGACAGPAASPRSADAPPATPAVFLSEGGLLRPVSNGGRVPIEDGSVDVSFAPYPPGTTSELSVVVRDGSGRPVAADVVVVYDMIGMEHGAMYARAVASGDRSRATIGLPMPGPWKFTLRVTRASEVSSLLFIVPDAP